MSIRSTSLEPKSQLTINLDPGWQCQSFPSKENKTRKFPIKKWEKAKKKENSQSKEWEKAKKKKKERKFPIKRAGESKKGKKVPNQRVRESKKKKERKFLIKDWKKTEEICRIVTK